MNQPVLYRNPSSGLIEVKEFSDKAPYSVWTRNQRGGIEKAPKQFAADAALGVLRIADPILTTISQGYQPQQGFVGDILFPSVTVDKRSGRFPKFGKEMLVIPTDIKRAIGGRVVRMQTSTGYVTLELDEFAMGFDVDREELIEWAGSSDQLLNSRQAALDGKLGLYRESLQMTLATTYGNYASGFAIDGSGKAWASSGDAVKDMRQLIQYVRKYNGQPVDVAWFTPTAWWLFTNNASVVDKIKYGGTPMAPADLYIGGEDVIARLLGVKRVVVAWATYGTGGDGGVGKTDLTMDWLWESVGSACAGCLIAGQGWNVPAFGYTYERKNSPIVESWYDNATKTMKYDTEHFATPAITKTDGGGMYYTLA